MTQLARFKNEKKKKNPIFWTGPVLAGGRLWLGNSRGEIVSADVGDGKLHDLDRLGKPISLAPVVAGGVLYYLDDSGKITAFR